MINWYKRDYFEGQQLKLLQAVDYIDDYNSCSQGVAIWQLLPLVDIYLQFEGALSFFYWKKIHRSLVWKLAANYKANQSWDLGPMQKFCYHMYILHDLCHSVSSTCRRTKITLFNHRRLYHSWWFSRWWGVESNSMEASRSYNLYNRLLQLVTCRANDNQDDESDKWWW